MPDYIYLLENRLSADQRHALAQLQTAARDAGILLFLAGDAVRDLTSGHSVRELEIVVHGNALKLKKPLEKLGGAVWGEDEASRTLYLCFPGTVRVDVVSAHRVEYPKPGKLVYHPASIQEDLHRRDFTVNAMALSLNEGSYGLLMDPMNGAADIEAHILRLVSNYGFLDDPSLLIRATRYRIRLGWEMDVRTQARYENAKSEGVIEYLSPQARSHELEQIGHEEDALKVLQAFEIEGWMKVLFPAWTSAKADEARLTMLHEKVVELLLQGVHPDMSAAQMQLLTAKLQPKDLSALKRLMLRSGFVEEWNHLDSQAAGFAKTLMSKQNEKPSASYKLFMTYDPEAVLWLGFTSKDKTVQERFQLFLKEWPEARQRIPYALMQEMRITHELPSYTELVEKIFLELIDGNLSTPEEMRAYLQPYSPPEPPPKATVKKSRVRRAEAKIKEEEFEEEEHEDGLDEDEELEPLEGEEEELDLSLVVPKGDVGEESEAEPEDEESEEEIVPAPVVKTVKKQGKAKKTIAVKPATKHVAPVKMAPAIHKKAEKASVAVPAKQKPSVKAPTKPAVKAPAKSVKKLAAVVAKPIAKPQAKAPKTAAKKPSPKKSGRR